MHQPKQKANVHAEIITRKRVADHGEVFTNPREIRLMMAQIAELTLIETRVLEPACGNGNFLYEILKEKLRNVARAVRNDSYQNDQKMIAAVASVYGIDLLQDNVFQCRARLETLCESEYEKITKTSLPDQHLDVIKHILSKNVVRGNALTMRSIGRVKKPIIFSEWTFVTRDMVKRRDYELANLASQSNNKKSVYVSDLERPETIPNPVATYPVRHFLELTLDA
jgi:hypothetical protein